MAKGGTIEYGIKFNVDKSSLSAIQSELRSIQSITAVDFSKKSGLPLADARKQMESIRESAKQLQSILNESFNTKLGTVNLEKFAAAFNKIDAKSLVRNLNAAGIEGSQALRNLTTEVLTVNSGFTQTNKLVENLNTTLKNTVKWGLSSAMFNGITRSISNAWTYAKNLDSSLNSIRRVSNASAEDMERFAKYANKAAQSMGKSTLDYTKGALIYYQQGLNEEEAKKRADITMKMSNVLGASTEDVSNYMTAIWNNFAEGSDNLEHFADVLTRLGATTASSAEEISTGLEKFASIGKTVGLSYEYAAAALATVTATTRQSADTVGTAFKTLFSRLQGLKLGETLDDGTTLNKYSEALKVIGVDIKDATGNLKDMDVILEEMGSKWQSLTDAQKVATAQTVGGIRQYSQLMALMDNWDTFKKNLNTANNATGELQRQQDIYMQSSEAHLEQLGAAVERIKAAFVDNKGINSFIDKLTGVTNLFGGFLESIGGGGTALLMLGSIATKVFGKTIAESIGTAITNFRLHNEQVELASAKLKAIKAIEDSGATTQDSAVAKLVEMEKEFLSLRDVATEEDEKTTNQFIVQRNELEQVSSQWEQAKKEAQEYYDIINKESSKDKRTTGFKINDVHEDQTQVDAANTNIQKMLEEYSKFSKEASEKFSAAWAKEQIKSTSTTRSNIEKQVKQYEKAANKIIKSNLLSDGKLKSEMAKILEEIKIPDDDKDYEEKSQKLVELVTKASETITQKVKTTGEVIDKEVDGRTQDLQNAIQNAEQSYNKFIDNLKTTQMVQGFLNIASGIGQIAAGLQSLSNIDDILKDDTISKGEKLLKVISALSMGFTSLAMGAKTIGSGFVKLMTTIPSASAALNGMTISTALQSKAFGALAASAAKAMLAILPYVAIAAAIAGAAYLIYNAVTADERAYENLLDAEEKFNERISKLNEEIQDLNTQWDSLRTAEDVLNGCTKYSTEWKEQLQKVNQQVQDILDKYPDLLKIEGMVSNKSGQLTLNEDLFKKYISQKESGLDVTTSAKYINELKIQQEDFKRWQTSKMFIPGVNQRDINNLSEQQRVQLGRQGISDTEYKETLANIAKEVFRSDARNQSNPLVSENSFVQDFIKKYEGYQKYFQEYSTQLQKISIATDNINSLMVDEDVAAEGQFASQRWAEQNNAVEIRDIIREGEKDKVHKVTEEGDVDAKTFMRWYIEALGQQWDETKFTNVNGTDEDRTYEYGDTTYNADEMAATIAAYLQKGGKLGTYGYNDEYWTKVLEDIQSKVVDKEAFIKQNNEILEDAQKQFGVSRELADKLLSRDLDTLTPEEVDQLTTVLGENGAEQLTQFFKDHNIPVKMSFDDMLTGSFNPFKNYMSGLKSYDPEKAAKNEKAEVEKIYSAGAEKTGHSVAGLKNVAQQIKSANKEIEYSDKQLAKYAVTVTNFNKNMDTLGENFNSNKDLLKEWAKGVENASDKALLAGEEFKKTINDNFGVDLSLDTIRQNFDTIQKAINGDKKALVEFQQLLAKEEFKSKVSWSPDIELSDEAKNTMVQNFNNSIDDMISKTKDFKIGAKFEDAEAINAMNKFLENSNWTADQANAYFEKIGFDADIEKKKRIVVSISHIPIGDTGMTIPIPTIHEVEVPVIKSVKKANRVSSYKPSTTPKGSGGSKGGGSSSKPKHEKEINEDTDRYHKVNTQITKIDKQLDKVQSKQKKLVGGELIKNLNQQWELLNTQIENYNKKLAIANKEQEELAKKLSGQGVKFNEDGTVSNYEESLKAAQERYNKQVRYYNSLSKSQQEKLDEKYDDYGGYLGKFKQEYEQFKSDIDRYDEIVVNVKPEIDKQTLDALDKQIEINIQKFNLKLTITVDMNQATRDWNAWKKKVIDGIKKDDILGNAKARAADFSTYFNKNGLGDVQVKTDQVNKILTELDKMEKGEVSSVYGYMVGEEVVNDKQKALDELKEKYTDLMETMSDELDLEEELYQNILDEMDKVQEKFDEQIKSYEFLRDMINHDIKVIQMVYGEDSYSDLAKFYDKQQENYENQLDFQRQQKDFWYAQMQAAEEGSEEWEKAKENWMNAVNQFNQNLEEGLENAKNKFENTINGIFQNLNDTITGGLGLDYVQKEWELINKNADRYLDTVNATYGIHSLERKYIDAINKSNDINVQQKLKKIMDEQVSNLKDRDRLTQYELDRANKLYDIELARVTLEEAQMNKSQMRLRRDSQGNYTYQYVANDEKIREAEQKLEDLYNQLYNFDKDRYNEVLNDAYNAWDEYQQKMRDAEIQYVHDEEELEKQKFLIQSQYDELIAQIEQDYQVSRTNLAKSLFTGLAASTATSLAETNTSYGIALTDAQGKTKIAFDLMSDTINEAFAGADTISSETFKKITEAAQKAGLTIDGYTSTSFNAIMEGFDSLEPKEKEALADHLIPTWNNGVSDMVKYFINGGNDKGGMKAIEDTFSGKISSMQTLFSGADGKGGFVKTVKDGWNKIDTAQNTYKADLGKLETAAGTTFKKILDGENGVYNQIDPLIKKNDELIDKYADELGAVQLVYAETMKLKKMFDQQAESAKKAAEEAYNYYVKEKELEAKTVENMPETKTSEGNGGNSGGDTGGDKGGDTGGGNPPSPQGNGKVDVGDYVTINSSYAKYAGGPYISGPSYKKGSKLYVQSIYDKNWVHVGTSTDFSNRKTWVGWIKVKDISGYDTGGYTGSWGKSGRLAMLHEKELVLNAKDTENMLNTVAIMRGLTYSLGSNMLSRLAGATASGYSGSGSGGDGILEQNVHIDATFPNVKNATEIEEALNNLVNAASQRAYERR